VVQGQIEEVRRECEERVGEKEEEMRQMQKRVQETEVRIE